MAIKFNPLTGNFDFTGSGGGGGSSYIDGEVQNFSALPQTIGSPAVDSAYLVREAEGTWLLARKPAGIYIRTANTGVRANDWTHAGAFPDVFNDANFLLYDNGDSTKNLAFQLSGITTGTLRTLTVPDANITIENTGHAAKHHTGGSDAIAPNNIGAESLFTASSFTVSGTTTTLSAGRAQIVTIIAFSATTINLPTTGNQYGDRLVIRGGSPVLGTITLSATLVSDTITAQGQQRSYVWQSTGTGDRWVLNSVDIHTHAAADVTSGVLNYARQATIDLVPIDGDDVTIYGQDYTQNGNLIAHLRLRADIADGVANVVLPTLTDTSVGEITLRVISGQEFSAIFIEVFDGEAEQIFGTINGPNELDADEELTFRWNNGRWDMDLRPNPFATTAVSIFKPNASGTIALTSLVGASAELVIACSDETSNLTTGTAKVTFRMPYAMTLSSVRASVNTAPTGSTLIVDINEGGSTILSTKLSIDASELTSTTAATAAVISDTALADDAEVTIDIDQIGSTIAGKGLKVVLKGTRA